jgi:hypothetical protein
MPEVETMLHEHRCVEQRTRDALDTAWSTTHHHDDP